MGQSFAVLTHILPTIHIYVFSLQFTKSTSNVLEGARSREKLISLLKEHEKFSAEVKDHRETIRELDFLLKQVQKEIKALRSKGTGFEIVSRKLNEI